MLYIDSIAAEEYWYDLPEETREAILEALTKENTNDF